METRFSSPRKEEKEQRSDWIKTVKNGDWSHTLFPSISTICRETCCMLITRTTRWPDEITGRGKRREFDKKQWSFCRKKNNRSCDFFANHRKSRSSDREIETQIAMKFRASARIFCKTIASNTYSKYFGGWNILKTLKTGWSLIKTWQIWRTDDFPGLFNCEILKFDQRAICFPTFLSCARQIRDLTNHKVAVNPLLAIYDEWATDKLFFQPVRLTKNSGAKLHFRDNDKVLANELSMKTFSRLIVIFPSRFRIDKFRGLTKFRRLWQNSLRINRVFEFATSLIPQLFPYLLLSRDRWNTNEL